ncbi:MAG: hypothetical protein HJJLKODD_01175 [Phycisphaerae bacterium]|nr:hypothetical protein [Phycisphaerae bacterium]
MKRWMGAGVIVVVVIIAWIGVNAAKGKSTVTDLSNYEISRRTFKVTLQEKGELKAAESILVKCEVEGRSTIISLIPEGTQVKKGDLLVELASDEIEDRVQSQSIDVANSTASLESASKQYEILVDQNRSNISKATLKLELAHLELKRYLEGEWPQKLGDANFRVQEAEKVLKREQEDLKAAQELVKNNFITRTEFEEDEFSCFKAEVDFQKAKRDREILEQFEHVKDLRQKNSDVEEAEKELARVEKEAAAKEAEQKSTLDARESELKLKTQRLEKLQEQMAKTKIIAPADGMVVYGDGQTFSRWGNEEQIKTGATVYEQQVLMQLPDTSRMKVVIRVHEAKSQRIQIGQRAAVQIEGFNSQAFGGEITKIAMLADSQMSWLNPELKEYETEITLDQTDAHLKPGVTAKAEILIDELHDVVAVPVQAVYTKGNKSFVFTGSTSNAQPQEVQLGLASTEFVEVRDGLKEGQNVLLQVPPEMRTRLPEVKPEELAIAQPVPPGAAASQPAGGQPPGQMQRPAGGQPGGQRGYRPGGGGGQRPRGQGRPGSGGSK